VMKHVTDCNFSKYSAAAESLQTPVPLTSQGRFHRPVAPRARVLQHVQSPEL
jgi:hypothetical protein